jgi:hypothetical protein
MTGFLLGRLAWRNGRILWRGCPSIWFCSRRDRNIPGPGHPEYAVTYAVKTEYVGKEEVSDHVHVLGRLRHHSRQLPATLVLCQICAHAESDM